MTLEGHSFPKPVYMKCFFIAVLMVFFSVGASAQKHNLFADAGVSFSRFRLGSSATYNYKFNNWLGVGAGYQGYSFSPTITNSRSFIPAVYGDLRFYIRSRKENQFFSFLDLGINLYKRTDKYYIDRGTIYHVAHDNGFCTGVGFGYFRRVTKSGWGPYTSIKMISNSYKADAYDTRGKYISIWGTFTSAFSVGFKL